MSSPFPSPEALVVRFLRTHRLTETLDAFVKEIKISQPLEPDASDDDDKNTNWTIELLIEEKIAFDCALNYEKMDGTKGDGWSRPAPSIPSVISDLPSTNMLSVSMQPFQYTAARGLALLVATACRQLHVLDPETLKLVSLKHLKMFDSPVMSCVSIMNGKFLAVITLSSTLTILNGETMESMGAVVHHNRHAVMVASYEDGNTIWLASAGFDKRVQVYRLAYDRNKQQLTRLASAPRKEILLPTSPECILITRDQATGNIVLVLSRADSNHLEYYRLRTSATGKTEICRLGQQNPVPQSSVWIPFSLSHFRLCPVDPGLLAIATSSTPNLKIIIVRMQIPPSPEGAEPPGVTLTTGNLARLTAQAPKSDVSLTLLQCTVPVPQTRYSKPQIAWRPDGCGVWVTGDDGVIRGVDVKNGQIVATLGEKEKGHKLGKKVRCIWAGMVRTRAGVAEEEWLVSGGFDKRLLMWKKNPDDKNIQRASEQ